MNQAHVPGNSDERPPPGPRRSNRAPRGSQPPAGLCAGPNLRDSNRCLTPSAGPCCDGEGSSGRCRCPIKFLLAGRRRLGGAPLRRRVGRHRSRKGATPVGPDPPAHVVGAAKRGRAIEHDRSPWKASVSELGRTGTAGWGYLYALRAALAVAAEHERAIRPPKARDRGGRPARRRMGAARLPRGVRRLLADGSSPR
jgi:hypothetical protein